MAVLGAVVLTQGMGGFGGRGGPGGGDMRDSRFGGNGDMRDGGFSGQRGGGSFGGRGGQRDGGFGGRGGMRDGGRGGMRDGGGFGSRGGGGMATLVAVVEEGMAALVVVVVLEALDLVGQMVVGIGMIDSRIPVVGVVGVAEGGLMIEEMMTVAGGEAIAGAEAGVTAAAVAEAAYPLGVKDVGNLNLIKKKLTCLGLVPPL
ncbi:hypothetical protein R6Q59_020169 [Mikania micrantha]